MKRKRQDGPEFRFFSQPPSHILFRPKKLFYREQSRQRSHKAKRKLKSSNGFESLLAEHVLKSTKDELPPPDPGRFAPTPAVPFVPPKPSSALKEQEKKQLVEAAQAIQSDGFREPPRKKRKINRGELKKKRQRVERNGGTPQDYFDIFGPDATASIELKLQEQWAGGAAGVEPRTVGTWVRFQPFDHHIFNVGHSTFDTLGFGRGCESPMGFCQASSVDSARPCRSDSTL
jgi:hypothetical protein